MVQKIAKDYEEILKIKQFKEKDRKKYENQLKNIKQLLKEEVDDRIADEIEKETVLKNSIKELEKNNEKLTATIKERNTTINNQRDEISALKNYIKCRENSHEDLVRAINDKITTLENVNLVLNNYIDYHLTNDIQKFNCEKEIFEIKKTIIIKDLEDQKIDLDKKILDADAMLRDVEIQRKKLAEKEEYLKKQENEINLMGEELFNALNICTNNLIERAENVAKLERIFNNLFNETKKEINTERLLIKIDLEKISIEKQDIKKSIVSLKSWGQHLQKYQEQINETGGLNKIYLPCHSCKKFMLIDSTDPENNQIISKAFENYMHPECIKKENQKNTLLTHAISGMDPSTIQSGISPIILSGENALVTNSSGESVIQSGLPKNFITVPETKGYNCSGDPNIQLKLSINTKSTPDTKIFICSGNLSIQSGFSSSN
jgi:hypothetical protein